MSGHSKWSTIKRTKGANDSKRALLFTKYGKKITLAVKEGNSPDPEHNFKLRLAIEKAKAISMPNDNIQRAIQKASRADGLDNLEEVVYEGYGPAGTAFIIEAITDNRNRTVANIKHILNKSEGSLGTQGSVIWQFSELGQILIEKSNNSNLTKLQLVAIDSEADDIEVSEEGLLITTKPELFNTVQSALVKTGAKITFAEITLVSQQNIELTETEKDQVQKLFDALEENEDVTNVITNAEL